MNRRDLIARLAVSVAATLDPERLLWVPKLISIPKPRTKQLHVVAADTKFDPNLIDMKEFHHRWLTILRMRRMVDVEAAKHFSKPEYVEFPDPKDGRRENIDDFEMEMPRGFIRAVTYVDEATNTLRAEARFLL